MEVTAPAEPFQGAAVDFIADIYPKLCIFLIGSVAFCSIEFLMGFSALRVLFYR